MIVPAPDLHEDWRSWANALRSVLSERPTARQAGGVVLPTHFSTSLPSAEQDGMLIWVSDLSRVAYSLSGRWRKIDDNGFVDE